MLYLPKKNGGLAIPALSTVYKQQQVSRYFIFSTSRDDCVQFLEAKQTKNWKHSFSSFTVVRDVQSKIPTNTKRRHIKSKATQQIISEDGLHCAQVSS